MDSRCGARSVAVSMYEGGDQRGEAITVVVADRHEFVRLSLRRLVDAEPGFAVVGDAGGRESAESELRERRPQALLLEPAVLGAVGLGGIRGLLKISPATRVVVLADELSSALDRHAASNGATETILKHAHPDELFDALRRAVHGPPRVPPLGLGSI